MDEVNRGVPDTRRELRDVLWGAANGYDRLITPLVEDATSLLKALDRCDEKDEDPRESIWVESARERLAERLGLNK